MSASGALLRGPVAAASMRPGSTFNPCQPSTSSHIAQTLPLFTRRQLPGARIRNAPFTRDGGVCRSQTRHFNMQFDPSKSNIPMEYNFTQPFQVVPPKVVADMVADAEAAEAGTPEGEEREGGKEPEQQPELPPGLAVLDVGPYQEFDLSNGNPHPRDTHWSGPAPPGSFSLPNTYAQRTRLTPLEVPEPGAGGSGAAAGAGPNPLRQLLAPLRREEYYGVEMELDYGREWPRLIWEDGTFVFRPGFLQPAIDPDLPAYWLHIGIARFPLGPADRAAEAVVAALYLAVMAAVSAVLYAVQPMLLAAAAVSWARNTLSLAKWAMLFALAAVDRVWLYFVFMAGGVVDRLLARHMPGVRNFCWANLALWGVYLLVTPSNWTLLPGVTV